MLVITSKRSNTLNQLEQASAIHEKHLLDSLEFAEQKEDSKQEFINNYVVTHGSNLVQDKDKLATVLADLSYDDHYMEWFDGMVESFCDDNQDRLHRTIDKIIVSYLEQKACDEWNKG